MIRPESGTRTDESLTTSVLSSDLSRYVCYALLLLTIVFFASIRYRLRAMPLERDEGEYAYGGQLILQGFPLYDLVYTVKLPGTHAAYAVLLALFGQSQGRIHVGLIFVNAATTLLMFLLCSRWFGRFAGLIAAATYALLSTGSSVTGFAAHATHFVVLFALAGAMLFLKAVESDRMAALLLRTAVWNCLPDETAGNLLSCCGRLCFSSGRSSSAPVPSISLAKQIRALLLGGILPFALPA